MATLERLSDAAARLGVPWYHVPGREKYTKASLPPASPNPGSDARWPIAPSKGRNLTVARFIAGKGPNSGRCIGYRRSSGARHHAGIDVYGKHKDVIVACEDGTIVNFYYFYNHTYALVINHGSFVIVYGEVDGSSLIVSGLKSPKIRAAQNGNMRDGDSKRRTFTSSSKGVPDWIARSLAASGSSVKAGQQIAIVGKMKKSSMLHFEMYTGGTANKGWSGFPNSSPPSGMLDPTNYLVKLSAKERGQPVKEVKLAPVHKTKT
jgi:murein DD-endopeptidase MepM/ murein hydrolase activator NlpD